MKSIKTNILFILFLFSGLFLIGLDKVEAGELNWNGVKIECIYSDGGAYTVLMGQSADFVNRVTYNLEGTSNKNSATSGNSVFLNLPYDTNTHQCYDRMVSGIFSNKNDDKTTVTTYYKFGNANVDSNDYSETPIQFSVNDFGNPGLWGKIFGSVEKDTAKEVNANKINGSLKSERYILTDDAGQPNSTLTYKQITTQASSSDNYAYVMIYSNATLLKTNAKTTLLISGADHFSGVSVNSSGIISGLSDEDIIYLNNPEASITIDSSSISSYSYRPGQVRYSITTENSGSTYDRATYNRAYKLFNKSVDSKEINSGDLCDDIMPETSKVIREIIKYAQILVPVFLIILTAIDIGKIVLAGNLDEEMPKQKKKIITRMICAIVFFFLPLITMLIIDLMKDSGAVNANDIQSIECIFQ